MSQINKNPLLNTTFSCEQCGAQKVERTCWYKKRAHHFCCRTCANRFKAAKVSLGLTRCEYEKQYWKKPENQARKKMMQRTAARKRAVLFGDSFKKMVLTRAKARSKKYAIPFNLTIDDFEIPEYCPILKIKLELGDKRGGSFNSPSLDRLIPLLGYTKGNVVVISRRANLVKSDAQLHELESIVSFMKSLHQPEVGQASFRV